jgi:DNA-binding IclR family transcriptional regulator
MRGSKTSSATAFSGESEGSLAPRRNRVQRVSDSQETALERAGVQSVGIAATILKALAAGGGVLPLKHLAAATGMPRAKVHRYLASLRTSGLITQDPETGHYAIGPAAVTIGLVGLGRLSPVRQLNDALPRLRNRVNETVTAAIWGDTGPTIIAIEESDHVVTMNVRIGSVLPLLTTAIGRVFLAYLPPSLTQCFVAAEQARDSAPSPPEPDEDVLSDIRERRLSRASSALLPGVDAMAAPVFDVRGKLVAVMCVVGRSGSTLCSWDGPVARALDQSARNLSRQLGCLDVATEPARDQGTAQHSQLA